MTMQLDTILGPAASLFAARGFEGVTFRDLTAATGAKRSLLLYHFQSKERLWESAMRHIMQRMNAAIGTARFPPANARDAEKFRAFLRVYIDALVAVPEYGQVLIREGVYNGPRLNWLVRHFVPAFSFKVEFADPGITARMSASILRDIVIAAPLFATALGPLMEASIARASSIPVAGIYPLTDKRRDELVDVITGLIVGKQSVLAARRPKQRRSRRSSAR
jgi:AcrR family transcriptional regulator